MAISVVLKDRVGVTLVRLSRAYVPLVGWADRREYPLLGHVDPYGHTIYNRGQMESLIAELESVRRTIAKPPDDKSAAIDELREICIEGIRKPHRYSWFLGD